MENFVYHFQTSLNFCSVSWTSTWTRSRSWKSSRKPTSTRQARQTLKSTYYHRETTEGDQWKVVFAQFFTNTTCKDGLDFFFEGGRLLHTSPCFLADSSSNPAKMTLHWFSMSIMFNSGFQGVTKRCRLSLLTNSAPQKRGEGGGGLVAVRGLTQKWVQLCTSRDMELK